MRECEILLVEEDWRILKAITWALEEKGYRVTTAAGTEKALETLQERRFDLVITGCVVVLKKVKEESVDTMVIFMAGDCSIISAINALRYSADDYLVVKYKIFDLVELLNSVNRCLGKLELRKAKVSGVLSEHLLSMMKVMAHDMRGALVSISADLKLLCKGTYWGMDEGALGKLKELDYKVMKLSGIFEECLGMAFSLDGDLEIRREVVDLKQDIIDPVLDELSPEISERSILLEYRLENASAADRPVIRASKIWLKTVFRNLLKNAITYGGNGCTVRLGFQNDRSGCRVKVYNSGKPIPAENREKLFRKFLQVGSGDNGSGSGLGLGLYLIKKIIEKHDGSIWYEVGERGRVLFLRCRTKRERRKMVLWPRESGAGGAKDVPV